MTHLAGTFFFIAVLIVSIGAIRLTVRDYWEDILAALAGELPVRSARRPWSRVRPSANPRPVAVRVQQPRHAVA